MQLSPLCTDVIAVKRHGPQGEAGVVRCKRWSCPVCRGINRRRVVGAGVAGHPTAMLTLTVSSRHYDCPDDAARDLKRGLVLLRRRIARRWPGQRLPFLAVYEKHKSGWPHLHLLIRAKFLPIRELRAMWEEVTGSWNVNITKIDTVGQAAFYAAKYVGKDIHAFHGCKRWWRSHDYNEPRERDLSDPWNRAPWSRWRADLPLLLSAVRALGATVEILPGERIRWLDPPDRTVSTHDAMSLISAWFPQRRAERASPGHHE